MSDADARLARFRCFGVESRDVVALLLAVSVAIFYWRRTARKRTSTIVRAVPLEVACTSSTSTPAIATIAGPEVEMDQPMADETKV